MDIRLYLLNFVCKLKRMLKCHTYHIEMWFVAFTLVWVALITNKWLIEWVWVLAVLLTFWHASVADRLEEKEEKIQENGNNKDGVRCWYTLKRYYYAKEICWSIYFILLWAWSAIIWVVLFLLYWPWRKMYRKHTQE